MWRKILLFHKNTNSAKLITNLDSEISLFIKNVLLGSIELLTTSLIILFSLVMIIFVNYYVSLFIILLILILYFAVIRVFRKKVEKFGLDRSKFATARLSLFKKALIVFMKLKIIF